MRLAALEITHPKLRNQGKDRFDGNTTGTQASDLLCQVRQGWCWTGICLNNLAAVFEGARPPSHTRPRAKRIQSAAGTAAAEVSSVHQTQRATEAKAPRPVLSPAEVVAKSKVRVLQFEAAVKVLDEFHLALQRFRRFSRRRGCRVRVAPLEDQVIRRQKEEAIADGRARSGRHSETRQQPCRALGQGIAPWSVLRGSDEFWHHHHGGQTMSQTEL